MNKAAVRADTARKPARAEVVGSLLRPRALREAIAEVYEEGHHGLLEAERSRDLSALYRVEDQSIGDAVRRQLDLGLDVVSDGEFRRYMFTNSFYDAVSGTAPNSNTIPFYGAEGDVIEFSGPPTIVSRLEKIDSPGAREAAYLASLTEHPFKVTFPAASFGQLSTPSPAYADPAEQAAHVLSIQKELIAEAIAAGCPYIQLDYPTYTHLVDERWLQLFAQWGLTYDYLLEDALRRDTEIVAGIPEYVTKGLHLCRGNLRGHWLAEGSLEKLAEPLFSLPYDVFLIEWDDLGRDGGYESIRFLPKGKVVAMGIISTKTGVVETKDELLRRMDEAAKYVDVEQLAITTQCGFASEQTGNPLDEDAQWRKLELVAEVADELWPR
jgi:methionine synthase II (cobalamin-independent)